MSKKEYLDLLRYYLRDLPKTITDDIISDYNEHFDIALGLGKNEVEISIELGSPKIIADQFLENENNIVEINTYSKENHKNPSNKENRGFLIFAALVGFVFLSPLILGLAGAGLGLVAAVIGVFIALLASSMALLVSGIIMLVVSIVPVGLPSFITIPNFFEMLNPITKISGSIFLICVSFILFYITFKLIEIVFKLIRQLIQSINWKLKKRWNKYGK